MHGERIGRLNVYIKNGLSHKALLWRLAGDQGDQWNNAQIPLEGVLANMVIVYGLRKLLKIFEKSCVGFYNAALS